MQQSATKSDLRGSWRDGSVLLVWGSLPRSLSSDGGYSSDVPTDAENRDRVPGGRASFGPKGRDEAVSGPPAHGNYIPAH